MSEYEMKKVLREEVTMAWYNLNNVRILYGDDDKRVERFRGKWIALDTLWYRLFPNEEY